MIKSEVVSPHFFIPVKWVEKMGTLYEFQAIHKILCYMPNSNTFNV